MTTQPTRADLHDKLGIAIRENGAAYPTALLVEVMDVIESHDASLERAYWWREVIDPDEMIPAGCPVRMESRDDAREHRATHGRSRAEFSAAARVFIDARWTPPRPAYKVGDVIETVGDVKRLPNGLVFLDGEEDAWQVDDGVAHRAGGGRGFMDGDFDWFPLTVIYVPEGEAK